MQWIEKILKKNDARRTAYWTAVIVSLSLFILGLIIAALLSRSIAMQNQKDFEVKTTQQLTSIKSNIQFRFQMYGQLLASSAALFSIKKEVSHAEWRELYDKIRVSQEYPSLLGVGYVTTLKSEETGAFEQRMRDEREDEITAHPLAPARDMYTAITYLEPNDTVNQKAIGYDMYSEPTRRYAMELARDTASPVLSGPVRLVQDEVEGGSQYMGILEYYPVYNTKSVPSTVAERQAHLLGFVYLVVRPGDIMHRYVSTTNDLDQQTVALYDTSTNNTETVLYESQSLGNMNGYTTSTQDFAVNNRWWRVELRSKDTLINTIVAPSVILGFGALLAAAAAAIGYRLSLRRLGSVEERYAEQVQQTKEELLALASHQLRTPASGVKQYLGILTSGMFGELTQEQAAIARKAYDANERQIHIVNELLYVSKVDTGQLRMEFDTVDLVEMTEKVVEQVSEMARTKDIQITLKAPSAVEVVGDDRYLPMVIENMLTNAVKYSYMSSKVEVEVRDDEDSARVIVKDYGVGIPKEDISRIFLKFDRIHNPLSHVEGGSGLGLFLALQLAEAHSGTIEVHSRPEKGSTFTLLLPKNSRVDNVGDDDRTYSER